MARVWAEGEGPAWGRRWYRRGEGREAAGSSARTVGPDFLGH